MVSDSLFDTLDGLDVTVNGPFMSVKPYYSLDFDLTGKYREYGCHFTITADSDEEFAKSLKHFIYHRADDECAYIPREGAYGFFIDEGRKVPDGMHRQIETKLCCILGAVGAQV